VESCSALTGTADIQKAPSQWKPNRECTCRVSQSASAKKNWGREMNDDKRVITGNNILCFYEDDREAGKLVLMRLFVIHKRRAGQGKARQGEASKV
jgi:hypothetical protein